MKRTLTSLMLAGSLLGGTTAAAEDLLQWQTNSLTYLYGKDFQVNPKIQQTLTFEHADSWKYGDNFIFVDRIFTTAKKTVTSAQTRITAKSPRACHSAKSSARRLSSAPSKTCCWP